MISFGKELKRIMKEQGISQTKMAEILNVTKTTVSYYTKGKREPGITAIRKMCKILEVTPNDLFDFHDYDLTKIVESNRKQQNITVNGGNVDIVQK